MRNYEDLTDDELNELCQKIDWAEKLSSDKEWYLLVEIKNRQIKQLSRQISYITLSADILDEKYLQKMNDIRCRIRNWMNFVSEIEQLLAEGITCRENEGIFGEILERKSESA